MSQKFNVMRYKKEHQNNLEKDCASHHPPKANDQNTHRWLPSSARVIYGAKLVFLTSSLEFKLLA